MTIKQRAQAFVTLGLFLQELAASTRNDSKYKALHDIYFLDAQELFSIVKLQNGWFTETYVRLAIESIGHMLDEKNMSKWLAIYDFKENEKAPKKIGLVMAGNIPLVGFHDFLTVLISGNTAVVKLSTDDKHLLPFVTKILCTIEPAFKERVEFRDGRLSEIDAVIATGSNNSARYFDYYFGKIPNIIRKNRNSVAVLNGDETPEELKKLGEDIFSYFGLGCRNVSKLIIPNGYDLNLFFNAIFSFQEIINHNKYANNFDYNRAVYLMGKDKEGLLENGFLFLVKSQEYASPVAVIFYEYFDDVALVNAKLTSDKEQVQCIVSKIDAIQNRIPFGKAQQPELWDYADNVNTMEFLIGLN